MNLLLLFTLGLIFATIVVPIILMIVREHLHKPAARPYAAALICLFGWSLTLLFEMLAEGFETKLFWYNMQRLGASLAPVFTTILAWEYYRQKRWDNWKLLLLLCVIPVSSFVLSWNNNGHRWMRLEEHLVTVGSFTMIDVTPGPWQSVTTAYLYALFLVSIYLLITALVYNPPAYRSQSLALIVSLTLPAMAGIVELYIHPVLGPLEAIPLTFVPSGLLMLWSLSQHWLFDLVPIARAHLFDSMPDGVMVIDNNRRVVDANTAITGWLTWGEDRPASVIGQRIDHLLLCWPQWLASYARPVETYLEVHMGTGRILDVHIVPLRSADGAPIGSMTIMKDSTLRKMAEARLRQSEARYRLLADNAHDFIWTIDITGCLTYVSPAVERILGYRAEEFINLPREQLFSPEAIRFIDDNLAAPRRETQVVMFEYAQQRQDGSTVWLELRVSPMFDDENAYMGILGFTRDVSERRAAEEHMLKLSLERERVHVLESFIRDASHDLRTPITVIHTSAYLLDRSSHKLAGHFPNLPDLIYKPNHLQMTLAEMESLIGHILERTRITKEAVSRLGRIVEGMLELTRLEHDSRVHATPYNLNTILAMLIESYRTRAETQGLYLQVDLADDLPSVALDVDKINRAFRELLDNAFQYTPVHGTVRISSYCKDNQVCVQVQDSGIGIDPGAMPHIFERFYRADQARSAHTGGAGLGLSIVRSIAESHAGSVTVESAPGTGSSFYLCLPLEHPALQDAQQV